VIPRSRRQNVTFYTGPVSACSLLAVTAFLNPVLAQTAADPLSLRRAVDPGPRPVGNQSISVKGAVLNTGITDFIQPKDAAGNGAGRQLPLLTKDQTAFWFASLAVFGEQVTVNGESDPKTNNPSIRGLGPAFNGDSCAVCHAFPTIGGSSPVANPQVALATAKGARNSIPPFITTAGPVREARFVSADDDGLPDGAVRPLFSIQGRNDSPHDCTLAQPDFAAELAYRNVVFRIPTPTFGLGYIENTSDLTLQKSFASTESRRYRLGIGGHFNTNGNDQTITRFGWKAQNKSLLLFSGEAANVEMGLTNELFSNERRPGQGCDVHEAPEDSSNIVQPSVLAGTSAGDGASLVGSGIVNFGIFMRLNAAPSTCAFDSGVDNKGAALCIPPTQSARAASIADGESEFRSVGCTLCHTETLTTGPSPFQSLNQATYHPYSDFAVHGMGRNLADGIVQGSAAGDEFRTAPLWGVGQRVFFLHDGRTSDLLEAILAHEGLSSEANGVIRNFTDLSEAQKQDVLNFLRSL
jgi:CxxC motif-containing protein (DUF1111 family)